MHFLRNLEIMQGTSDAQSSVFGMYRDALSKLLGHKPSIQKLYISLGHAVDQAIPLLFLQEDGQIKLNKEDLRIIAQHPDVRDNPVAVLSINADPETLFHHQKPKGIGNLLNFLLIFLESTMDENWIPQLDTRIPLKWKRIQRKNIWLWNKPYVIQKSNGEKVALLLIEADTNSFTRKFNTFAFTCLLSSLQIYFANNTTEDFDFKMLNGLEPITTAYQKLGNESTCFQEICFLSGDWFCNDESKCEGSSDDSKLKLGDAIQNQFEKVESRLLPYPGPAIAKYDERNDYNLTFGDLTEESRMELGNFFHHVVFKCTHARHIGNEILTGKNLVKFVKTWFGLTLGNNFPNPCAVMKAFSSIRAEIMCTTLLAEYCHKMKPGELFFKQHELQVLHEKTEATIIEKFEKQFPEPFDEQRTTYRKCLENEIKLEFSRLSKSRDNFEMDIQEDFTKIFHQFLYSYKEQIEVDLQSITQASKKILAWKESSTKQLPTSIEFKEKHDRLKPCILKDFAKTLEETFMSVCPNIVDERGDDLELELDKTHLKYERKRFLLEMDMRYDLEHLVMKCFKRFKLEWQVEDSEAAKKLAVDNFAEKAKKTFLFLEYENKLIDKINRFDESKAQDIRKMQLKVLLNEEKLKESNEKLQELENIIKQNQEQLLECGKELEKGKNQILQMETKAVKLTQENISLNEELHILKEEMWQLEEKSRITALHLRNCDKEIKEEKRKCLQLDNLAQQQKEELKCKIEEIKKLKERILKMEKEEKNQIFIATFIPSHQLMAVKGEEGLLGRGGFGCVRLGFTAPHGPVAIKCFPVTGSKDTIQQAHDRVMEEIRNTKLSTHKNVVQVEGYSHWPGAAGIVMEYLPAGDLHTFLSGQSRNEYKIPNIAPVVRLRFCANVASGISFLHYGFFNDQRMTHGDIKSENILLTSHLTCKVSDFGGANYGTTSNAGPTLESQRNVFTYLYASPERLLNTGLRTSKAMDVYSFSMISHEVLTRKPPFRRRFSSQDLINHVAHEGNRPSLDEVKNLKQNLRDESDVEIIDLIKNEMVKCWNQDPDRRPSMMDVRDTFIKCLQSKDESLIAQHVLDITKKMQIKIPDLLQQQDACAPIIQFKAPDFSGL
ncbi:uncharacterized protein LOC143444251 isoform X3 [Clavelina lepadiformis]|uniref:uncharacterized protein LOC143444251 isoform X3 n=1 Tax=Clavelina lepadiformis TaxID=159417 RepID=UPI004041B743